MTRFVEYISKFGFTSFLISGLPIQTRRPDPFVLLNRWPSEWFERYTSKHYYRHDPVAQRCFGTVYPFTWDELPGPLRGSKESRLAMSEAADFGLAKGLSVPMNGFSDFQAIATMAGAQVEISPEDRLQVQLASIYAYGAADRAARINVDERGRRLTARERDVIRWVTEGKSYWEISEILGISKATVAFHAQHIREKMDARTIAQAVVEVIRRREISM